MVLSDVDDTVDWGFFGDITEDFDFVDAPKAPRPNKVYVEKRKRKNNWIPPPVPIEYITLTEQKTNAPEGSTIGCRHWKMTKGHCLYGDQCNFLHSAIQVEATKVRTLERLPSGKRKRKRPKNRGRAGEFRRWLISVYGRQVLTQGSGILDIAGGKGELSFELMNLNNIPCTIVDPRGFIDYSKHQRKFRGGYFHKTEPLQQFNDRIDFKNAEIFLPKHIKLFWTPMLWETVGLAVDNPCVGSDYYEKYVQFRERRTSDVFDSQTTLNEFVKEAEELIWSNKGLSLPTIEQKTQIEEVISVKQSEGNQENEYKWENIRDILENCSCIIGMHPDQAAESIVDFALRLGKPFALTPCCTYSKQFPKRKNENGEHVKNYSDLVAHLCSKHPDIKVDTLPFEGKNKVLYWIPNHLESIIPGAVNNNS